jgi:hypothetical protein
MILQIAAIALTIYLPETRQLMVQKNFTGTVNVILINNTDA